MKFKYDLLKYQDKLYYIYRKVGEDQIKEGKINELRDFWGCDVTLKNKTNNDNKILFLREIPDAIIVEDEE